MDALVNVATTGMYFLIWESKLRICTQNRQIDMYNTQKQAKDVHYRWHLNRVYTPSSIYSAAMIAL